MGRYIAFDKIHWESDLAAARLPNQPDAESAGSRSASRRLCLCQQELVRTSVLPGGRKKEIRVNMFSRAGLLSRITLHRSNYLFITNLYLEHGTAGFFIPIGQSEAGRIQRYVQSVILHHINESSEFSIDFFRYLRDHRANHPSGDWTRVNPWFRVKIILGVRDEPGRSERHMSVKCLGI